MSQLDSTSANAPRGVLVQKPKTNIYTVMLIIAFLSMLFGCLFLYLELSRFSG
ncbi:hypothetical protein KOR34_40940 [Posidoniimonas corsicana]|uniref:Uncharacterized protein n=1 Tax=Posidoniimonas corsicana TaxID=1938618 RepID=A0A5C5V1Q7_9BACT|nr:hypothetical protein [Posidoniimonas corsicana]TWT32331.1 hypothetical protein KOR34_40940 [Posidoniimonas corsicana]